MPLSVECYSLGTLLSMEAYLSLSFPSGGHCDKGSKTIVHLGDSPRKCC